MQQDRRNIIDNLNTKSVDPKYKVVIDYVKEHLEDYSNLEIRYLLNNADMLEDTLNLPDTMRQIYDELGLIDDDKNAYKAFVDLLKDNFDIDRNIIEVGGGVIPSVAKRISSMQDTGSVIVYDPELSKSQKQKDNLILKKQRFELNTDVSGADMIIGFMPCDATELLIRKATDNKLDFLVALCEGGRYEFDDFFDTEAWTDSILCFAKNRIKENGLGELVKTDLKAYGDPYPVIYNKRKILK